NPVYENGKAMILFNCNEYTRYTSNSWFAMSYLGHIPPSGKLPIKFYPSTPYKISVMFRWHEGRYYPREEDDPHFLCDAIYDEKYYKFKMELPPTPFYYYSDSLGATTDSFITVEGVFYEPYN